MKVLIYDNSRKVPIGLKNKWKYFTSVDFAWKIGALFFSSAFDAIIPASSWDEALLALEKLYWKNKGPVNEIQLWSHGLPGRPFIGGESLNPKDERLKNARRWWFRCCYVLAGTIGHEFASELLRKNCEVAGHTAVIGTQGVHSYLYATAPGTRPWWPQTAHDKSTIRSPRTIIALKMDLPSWAFHK